MYQAQGAAVAFIPPAGAGALRASFVSPLQPQAFGLRLPLRHELGSDRTAHARRPSVAPPAAAATLQLPSSCQGRLRYKSPRTPGAEESFRH